jgi:hypothetical protein
MPFYKHPDVADAELSYIRNSCNRMVLVSAYTFGDSYATVIANVLAESPMLPGDFTLGASGNNRTLTVAPKSDASANASGGGVSSHTVLLDTLTGRVLLATEESEAQSIVAGSAVSIGGFVITNAQPIFG